jgi:hypothetical protein
MSGLRSSPEAGEKVSDVEIAMATPSADAIHVTSVSKLDPPLAGRNRRYRRTRTPSTLDGPDAL